MKKLIIIPILILCLVTFVSAYLYDDFSNEELDQNKWSASGNMDEYYVENGVFHTAQNSGADRYTNLMMVNQEFTTGDVVEYDLVYESGSGNRMSNIIIDNIELNHYAILVGYWNEVQQSGNDFGTYHFRVEFVENTVNVFVTKPNGETVQINIGNPQINGNIHTFGVGTRTGHNGIVEMDFDNFVINPERGDELEYHIIFQATGEEVILNTKNVNNNLINNVLFYYDNNLERIKLGEDIDEPLVVENGFSVTNNSMGESELSGMNGIRFLFSMNDESYIVRIKDINTLNNKTTFYDETITTEWADQEFTPEANTLFTFMPSDFRINFSRSSASRNPNDQIIFADITNEEDGISKIKTFEGARITLSEQSPEIIIDEIIPNNHVEGRITIDLNYNNQNQEINIGNINVEGNNQWLNNAGIIINRSIGSGTDEIRIFFNPDEESTFEERFNILEQQIEELNERLDDLEQNQEELNNRTSFLETTINNLEETLNNFMERINGYFIFLPRDTRRGIVCSYMRENQLDNYEDLGLSCEIRNRGNFWWLRNNCVCR